jgi:hypothetical protein
MRGNGFVLIALGFTVLGMYGVIVNLLDFKDGLLRRPSLHRTAG